MGYRIGVSSSAGEATPPTLDRASLESMEVLGKQTRIDLLSHLITIFLEDTTGVMRELSAGVTSGDARTIRMMAHRLKGGCCSFGARALMVACADLENLGSTGEVQDAAEVFERVEREYGQVRRALEQVLAGRRSVRA